MRDSLGQEKIVGSPDMTPPLIAAAAKEAGLTNVSLPTCSVAGVTDRDRHAGTLLRELHAHPRARGERRPDLQRRWRASPSADGKGTNDKAAAVKSDSGQPLDNPVRAVWISETAFSTALNVSYMAEQLALFGIVVGVALLLSGIGFIVLAAYGMLRLAETAVKTTEPASATKPALA